MVAARQEAELPRPTIVKATRDAHALSATQRGPDRSRTLLSVVFFASPLATSLAPRLTALFIAMAGAALIIPAMRRGMRWSEFFPHRAALAACLLFAAYAFVNAAWSIDPIAGLGKAALLTALILVSFAAVKAAGELERDVLVRAGIAFAAGALLGALFITTELLTDGVVTRTLVGWIPSLSSPKHFKVEDGELVALRLSKLDQNVNLALFHLWPGLLALTALPGARRSIARALFIISVVVVIALSEHDSSQVALIGSAFVVVAAVKWRTAVIRVLAVAWCAAFALVLPASIALYEGGWHLSDRLPTSARARIILWQYTAEQTFDRPFRGVGVNSTPELRKQQKATEGGIAPEGFVYPRTMGHHAHNIYLQSWYELGVIGALLLAMAGAAVALLMLLLPPATQAYAAGSFAAFAIVSAFAWGMWQSWFLCAVALLPIYLRLGMSNAAGEVTEAARAA